MPVEREEGLPLVGFVAQDDDSAVILRRLVVRQSVDNAGDGRPDTRANRGEEVEPEMNRPAFVQRRRPGREGSA